VARAGALTGMRRSICPDGVWLKRCQEGKIELLVAGEECSRGNGPPVNDPGRPSMILRYTRWVIFWINTPANKEFGVWLI
jgi:hypothetical protein